MLILPSPITFCTDRIHENVFRQNVLWQKHFLLQLYSGRINLDKITGAPEFICYRKIFCQSTFCLNTFCLNPVGAKNNSAKVHSAKYILPKSKLPKSYDPKRRSPVHASAHPSMNWSHRGVFCSLLKFTLSSHSVACSAIVFSTDGKVALYTIATHARVKKVVTCSP
jgi:hypothetical protein